MNPTDEQILEDLLLLTRDGNFRMIRTYDSHENAATTLRLIREHDLDLKVLLGASRKSFLGLLTDGRPSEERLAGSLACALHAAEAGVDAVRVHDVRETWDALRVWARVRCGE